MAERTLSIRLSVVDGGKVKRLIEKRLEHGPAASARQHGQARPNVRLVEDAHVHVGDVSLD